MGSNKGLGSVIAACLIIACAANVIIWIVPFMREGVFWASYVFVWLATFFLVGINVYTYSKSRTMKSALYHVSLSVISVVYMIVACGVSIVFMFMPFVPVWMVVLVQVVLLCLCLLGFIGGQAGAQIVDNMDEVNKAQVSTMQVLRVQSESLAASCTNPEIRPTLEKLQEAFRYSDPVSSDATHYIEDQLEQILTNIGQAMVSGDSATVENLSAQAEQLISQRNMMSKMYK